VWLQTTVLEPLNDHVTAFELDSDPAAARPLADVKSRAASPERIEDEIPHIGGELHDPVKDFRRELVGLSLLALELPVPHGRDVVPDIHQVDSLGVHRATMPTVVLDLAAAMATGLDRSSDVAEPRRLALGVIQQAVVGRVEPAGNRQDGLDA